jgi:hypothetical protein
MRRSKQKLTVLTTATVRTHQGAPENSCNLSGIRTHFVSEKLTLWRTNSEEGTFGGRGAIPNRRLVTSVSTTEITHGPINARRPSLAIHVNELCIHIEHREPSHGSLY